MAKTAKAGASTRSFATLLGLPPRAAKGKGEGEPPKTPDEPDKDKDKDKEAAAPAAEQAPDTEDNGKAECAVCEGTGTDEDGDKCEACDGTGEVGQGEEPVKESGAAKAETDDDAETKGRKAERTRWTRVLSHPAAGAGRVALACHMLSTTDMKAAGVIAALSDVPAATAATPRDNLYSRMNAERPPNPGVGSAERRPAADDFGSQVAAAVGKVRTSKK